MRTKIVAALMLIIALLAFAIPDFADGRGGGRGGGKGYSKGYHTGGHKSGGSYKGGKGKSHKGGKYKNPPTGDHYRRRGGQSSGSSYRSSTRKSSTSRRYSSPPTFHSGVKRDNHGRIARSQGAKDEFLKQRGYSHVPEGYHVDHIVPLYAGGRDDPSNMQLLTVQQHKQKTKDDFRRYGR